MRAVFHGNGWRRDFSSDPCRPQHPDALQCDHAPDERPLHRDVACRGVAVYPAALLERDVVVRRQDFAFDRAAYRHRFLCVNRTGDDDAFRDVCHEPYNTTGFAPDPATAVWRGEGTKEGTGDPAPPEQLPAVRARAYELRSTVR